MNKNVGIKLALALSAFLLVVCINVVLLFSHKISRISDQKHHEADDIRSFYIVVTGGKNKDALNSFYNGANSVSEKYDSVVQLKTGFYNNSNLPDYFSYPKDAGADGVLVFSDDKNLFVPQIKNSSGVNIPVVLTGICSEDSKYTRKVLLNEQYLRKEIGEFLYSNIDIKKVAVFTRTENISDLEKGLENEIKKHCSVMEVLLHEENSIDEEFRKKIVDIVNNNKADAFFCLSDRDTEIASEIIVDLNYAGKTKIFGIGETEKCLELEEKGVVAKLIKYDSYALGVQAMKDLFLEINMKGQK